MKSCYIKHKDNKLEVRAPNGAPSLLFQKALATLENNSSFANKITGVDTDVKALKLWSHLSKDETLGKDINGEPNFSINILGQKDTNVILDNLWAILAGKGVTKVGLQTYAKQFKEKNGYDLGAIGVSDPLQKIVAWKDGDTKTATEEMSHMLTATMLDDPTYKRLLTIVEGHPEFQEIYDKYIVKPLYNDALARKEVVDKLIRDVLLDRSVESIPSRILRSLRALLRKAFGVFESTEIKDFAVDLKEKIRRGNLEITNDFSKGSIQLELDNSTDHFEVSSELEDLITKLRDLRDGEKNQNLYFEIDKQIENFEKPLRGGNEKRASIQAINSISNILAEGLEILKTALDKDRSTEELSEALRRSQDKIIRFKEFIEDINKDRIFNDLPQEVQSEVALLTRAKTNFDARYKDIELILAERLMSPFAKLMTHFKAGEYRLLLEEAKNISSFHTLTQALGNLNDDVLKLFDLYYKKARQVVIKTTNNEAEEIMRLRAAITDYDDLDFIQKADGQLSRYFVNPENINYAAFKASKDDFIKQLRLKMGLPSKGLGKIFKEDPDAGKEYNKAIEEWLIDNQEAVNNVDEIIAAKVRTAIKDIFSISDRNLETALIEDLKAKGYKTDQYYAREFIANYEETHPLSTSQREKIDTVVYGIRRYVMENSFEQEGVIYFKKELSKPKSDKYHDDSYSKLSQAKRNYLDHVIKIKRKSFKLPVNPSLLYRIPQMRKSTVQRLQEGDIKGITTNFMDQFKFNEDESDHGTLGKDKDGELTARRLIPVYFINRVPMEDMSTDIQMLTNSFGYMANHYIEMRKIEASILLLEDVVSKRKIKGSPSLLGGNQAERLSLYIDANIYGQHKKQEGVAGKVLDFLGNYASMLGLGYNVYSPTANVLQAISTIAQEKAAKIYDKKAFSDANSFYSTHLAKSLQAFDNPSVDSELTGIGRLFNVRDEFMQQVIKNSPSESTAIKRIAGSPYSLNNIGEHFGAYKMALTILADKKVLYKGKTVSLLTMIDHKDFSSSIRDGVTELDGSPVDIDQISLKIHDVNQRLFGIYNKVDQNKLQHFALGRLVMTFRKFIFSPGNRAWANQQRNYQQGIDERTGETTVQEGMYMSMVRIFTDARQVIKDDHTKSLTGQLQEEWKNMDQVQRENWLRIRKNLAIITGAFLVFMAAAAAMTEDDEDMANIALAYVGYQARRHVTEMSFFFNPLETLSILRSPAASVSLVENLLKMPYVIDPNRFLQEGNPFREYQDGSLYITKKTTDLVPLVKGIRNATNVQELFELRTK